MEVFSCIFKVKELECVFYCYLWVFLFGVDDVDYYISFFEFFGYFFFVGSCCLGFVVFNFVLEFVEYVGFDFVKFLEVVGYVFVGIGCCFVVFF